MKPLEELKHKRHTPEDAEEKEEEKKEKKKRGRPSTGITPEERLAGKHAKREKVTAKKAKNKKRTAAEAKALEQAKEFSASSGIIGGQGSTIFFKEFSVDGFVFTFAFKWTWLDDEGDDLMEKLCKVRKSASSLHLAIPKSIERIKQIRNYVVVEIYKKYEEDLHDKLKREKILSIDESRMYFAGLLEALGGLHKVGLIHNDLKPDNLAITKSNVLKIIDYGNMMDDTKRMVRKSGNPYYDTNYPMTRPGHEVFAATNIFLEMITGQCVRCTSKEEEDAGVIEALDRIRMKYGEGLELDIVTKVMKEKIAQSAQDLLSHPFFKGKSQPNPLKKRLRDS